ncbi:MAG: hypothetical protein Q9183_008034, partial [Haloplaca sp. 2 TL-2023]
MISRRAQVGWTTHGHSAVDVNIYASDSRQASPLRGNRENTEIGKFMVEYMGLEKELEAVEQELRAKGTGAWMGKTLDGEVVSNRGDHYEGDFKMRQRDMG